MGKCSDDYNILWNTFKNGQKDVCIHTHTHKHNKAK